MIRIPTDKKDLLFFANEMVEQCRVSVGVRSAYYAMLNAIAETGRYDGAKSLINMLYKHLDRTAAHLFSPIELKFQVDYDRPKPKVAYDRAAVAAKTLTRTWERNNTDITFHRGVFESLKYGCAIQKQWVQVEGDKETPVYYDKLVMPWQFGVYREDENKLDRQEVLCETSMLTYPEVWQRIFHLPDAEKLFRKIKTYGRSGEANSDPSSFFHQILSTSQINTTGSSLTTAPGGIMQLNNSPNYSIMGPIIAPEVVEFHELWIKDEYDYTTVQVIAGDILVSPLYKKANLLVQGSRLQPYRIIQPNEVTNWFWGRSELVDLIEPQALLSQWCDDIKRLFGLQIDKILGFIGEGGVTDELYGQFRQAGYINLPQGASINDLTPKMPPEAIPMLKFMIETINVLGGFPPIMQGQGEPGVRAGSHAGTLMKTASPSLRDRSLLVERQCAGAADLTLAMMEAKDSEFYWLKADEPVKDVDETKFLLSELDPDWRVSVDSHSSSPIFQDENTQLIFAGAKLGYITGEYVIDNMPFPNKERAKLQLREKEAKQAQFMQKILQEHPEVGEKLLVKQAGGKR